MKLLNNRKSRLKCGRLFIVLVVLLLFPVHLNNQVVPIELTKPIKKVVVEDSEELKCMIKLLYFEAQGEGDKGMKLIAHVVLNRTKDKRFPNTVCGVWKESGAFSVTSKKASKKIPTWYYRHIKKIAQNAIQEATDRSISNTTPPITKALWFKRCDTEDSFFNTRKLEQKYKRHCLYI